MLAGLDLLLLAVFAIALFLGWRKGLVSSLIGLLGTVVSLVGAFLLADDVARYLSRTYGFGETLAQKIASFLPLPEEIAVQSADFNNLGLFYTWLEGLHLPSGIRTKLVESMKEYIDGLSAASYANLLDGFSHVLAEYVLIGLSFLGLWLLLWVVFHFLGKCFVGIIHHTPIIGTIDSLGGALISLAMTALIAVVLYTVIEALLGIGVPGESGDVFLAWMQESRIMTLLQAMVAPYWMF